MHYSIIVFEHLEGIPFRQLHRETEVLATKMVSIYIYLALGTVCYLSEGGWPQTGEASQVIF